MSATVPITSVHPALSARAATPTAMLSVNPAVMPAAKSAAMIPGTQIITAQAVSLGGGTVELLPRQPYEVAYQPTQHVIGFVFERQTGMHSFASDRRRAFTTAPNSLAFTPAGCDLFSSSPEGGEYLRIAITPERLGQAMANRGFAERLQLRQFTNLYAPACFKAAHGLRRIFLQAGPCAEAVLLAHIDILVEQVVSHLCARQRGTWQGQSPLTPRRLKLICDAVEEGLSTNLHLNHLAELVGLSPPYLVRLFASAMGQTPYAYIVERRLARARFLLRTTPLAGADIADQCGFSSQAHMITSFKRIFGTTPKCHRT